MTSCEPINCPSADAAVTVRNCLQWQSGVETQSGYAMPKLRLELAPSVSDAFTMFNSVGAKI